MSETLNAFHRLLPAGIERAEIEEPTLLLGGSDWSLSVTCDWRWVRADGSVVSDGTVGREDLIWDLAGEEIVAVRWSGPGGAWYGPLVQFQIWRRTRTVQ